MSDILRVEHVETTASLKINSIDFLYRGNDGPDIAGLGIKCLMLQGNIFSGVSEPIFSMIVVLDFKV